MDFIEHSDHMKDQWSKPKPKLRFSRHTEPIESNNLSYKTNKLH